MNFCPLFYIQTKRGGRKPGVLTGVFRRSLKGSRKKLCLFNFFTFYIKSRVIYTILGRISVWKDQQRPQSSHECHPGRQVQITFGAFPIQNPSYHQGSLDNSEYGRSRVITSFIELSREFHESSEIHILTRRAIPYAQISLCKVTRPPPLK